MAGYSSEWGSETARGGYDIEETVVKAFNNWREDSNARFWLRVMSFNPDDVENVRAEPYHVGKADVKVTVKLPDWKMRQERISVKKVNGNYNQVDRRSVDNYAAQFGFSEEVARTLKKFCGVEGHTPTDLVERGELERSRLPHLYDSRYSPNGVPRRLTFREIAESERTKVFQVLEEGKEAIVRAVLAGEPPTIDWLLVVQASREQDHYVIRQTHIESLDDALTRFTRGRVETTPRGSVRIGEVIMQRKGGTPDPESLQFKIKPWPR